MGLIDFGRSILPIWFTPFLGAVGEGKGKEALAVDVESGEASSPELGGGRSPPGSNPILQTLCAIDMRVAAAVDVAAIKVPV